MSTAFIPVDGVPGLFTAERRVWTTWSLRCFALALPGGGTLVVSPVKGLGDDAFASLSPVGAPKVFLAPNHFHHVGVPEWSARFPGAFTVCSETARPRLTKQRKETALRPLSDAVGLLPKGASFLEPAGTRNGETWLRLEAPTGVTWVVSDAFFWSTQAVPGPAGLFLRLTRAVPGLAVGNTFKWLATKDRAAYKAWVLAQLEKDRPTRMCFGHGETLFDEQLAARLKALVEARY